MMKVRSLAVPLYPSELLGVLSVFRKSHVCSPSDLNSSPGLDSQLPKRRFSRSAFNDSFVWLLKQRTPAPSAGERRLRRVMKPSRGVCRWRSLGGTAYSIRRTANRCRLSLLPEIIYWIEPLRLKPVAVL